MNVAVTNKIEKNLEDLAALIWFSSNFVEPKNESKKKQQWGKV